MMSSLRVSALGLLVTLVFYSVASAEEELDLAANRETKTSVYVTKGSKVLIRARGTWSMGPFVGTCGPDGFSAGQYAKYNLTSISNHGALIARVGNGVWNTHGEEFTAKTDGYLFLCPNDAEMANNAGSLRVVITVDGR